MKAPNAEIHSTVQVTPYWYSFHKLVYIIQHVWNLTIPFIHWNIHLINYILICSQLQRKRHIGNDIVCLVFLDGPTVRFRPSCIKSHFLHVFIVVRPVNTGGYNVSSWHYIFSRIFILLYLCIIYTLPMIDDSIE